MRGILPSGEAVEVTRARRLNDQEVRRDRDELIWDHRFGVRTREGRPPMPVAQIAIVFNLNRIYVHQIIARMLKRQRRAKPYV